MELNFDIRGNLKPYEIIEISMEIFQKTFVNPFEEESIRQELFENYKNYMNDLLNLVEYDFYQLIDGSYVSTKKRPKDIDLVTILDYRDYEGNKEILEKEFASFAGRKKYKVDGYIMSDLLYWRNLFGKTRVNRAKKQYEKGIIRLNYTNDGK